MGSRLPRVLINDRCLRGPRSGVGHYVAELLAHLPEAAADLHVAGLCRRWLGKGAAPVERTEQVKGTVPFSADRKGDSPCRRAFRRSALWSYGQVFRLAGCLGRYTLYHEPNYIPGPWRGPIVTTVHDLSALRYPQWHPAGRVRWYERAFAEGVRRTTHFVTVSEFTRDEMVNLLGISADRISVIGLGVRSVFHPRPAGEVARWLASRGLPAQYLLYAGTIEPRKNLDGLLHAYARLSPAERRSHPLLLAGGNGWGDVDIAGVSDRLGITADIRRLGYTREPDLAMLYAGARTLVWPSWYEGFGLPPLEAMASGTPVIAARAGAVPEVVQDVGTLVDPADIDALAAAMQRAIADDAWCSTCSERGLERSRAFSWSACAAGHAAVYRHVLNRV